MQDYLIGLMGAPIHDPDISAQADLVIQQMASSPWSDGPLTVITASEPARLLAALQSISQPRFWAQLDGSRAVFSQADSRLDVSSGLEDAVFVVTQPNSIGNWRLVLAGYYSNNPLLYSLAVLLIASGVGIICGRTISASGQSKAHQGSAAKQGQAHA